VVDSPLVCMAQPQQDKADGRAPKEVEMVDRLDGKVALSTGVAAGRCAPRRAKDPRAFCRASDSRATRCDSTVEAVGT
jgi:hypothetical protein